MFKNFMAFSILLVSCGSGDESDADLFGGSSPDVSNQAALATYGDWVRITGDHLGTNGERRVSVARRRDWYGNDGFPQAKEIRYGAPPDLAKPVPGTRRVGQCVVRFSTSYVGFEEQKTEIRYLDTFVQNKDGEWVDDYNRRRDGSWAQSRIDQLPDTFDVIVDTLVDARLETYKVTLTTLSPMALRLDSETNGKSSRQENLRLSWTIASVDPDERAVLILDNDLESGGALVACPINLNAGILSIPKEILQILNRESLSVRIEREKVSSAFFNSSEIIESVARYSTSVRTKLTNLPREQIE